MRDSSITDIKEDRKKKKKKEEATNDSFCCDDKEIPWQFLSTFLFSNILF